MENDFPSLVSILCLLCITQVNFYVFGYLYFKQLSVSFIIIENYSLEQAYPVLSYSTWYYKLYLGFLNCIYNIQHIQRSICIRCYHGDITVQRFMNLSIYSIINLQISTIPITSTDTKFESMSLQELTVQNFYLERDRITRSSFSFLHESSRSQLGTNKNFDFHSD